MTTYTKEFYEKYIKPYREKNRQRIYASDKLRREKKRRAIIELLGGKCVLCNRDGSKTSLIIHEVHGKPHSSDNLGEILAHLEDYTLLCRPHHATLHRLKNEGKLMVMLELLANMLELHPDMP